ncbi:MAG: hypothetical protein HYR64_02705 [Fimbriimonas ginsengisoli]|uniref:Uncharacterized protein n=1 Tax=Fimbriimonas ginsengisoli TaxID=1005039 RepID=A0A931PTZ4_FIMGI|nr:hypothetical protein [Fimbriimonas ginsengisoli]
MSDKNMLLTVYDALRPPWFRESTEAEATGFTYVFVATTLFYFIVSWISFASTNYDVVLHERLWKTGQFRNVNASEKWRASGD